ncbi:MAG TPA: PstS family phosphate ABC transporter substrate-binding protein [Acidobacteriota bacterium]|nr:PstS family phosphate ABC transporter substrate-binding protein [Acidobacteriota bacterium]
MKRLIFTLIAALPVLLVGCGGGNEQPGARTETSQLSGTVAIDGSSTVFPITEAVAEEFQKVNPRVRVTVGISGTGGGFKKFTIGEIDINDASRPIKDQEIAKAVENNVAYIELPVAFDGISVVVHPDNTFVDMLTVEELKKIWQPGSTVQRWSDVRPEWPAEPIRLYGPGTDSGTFDYFTEAVNGKSQSCRADFTASEDDNVLAQGVAGDRNALGFFGFAYYVENASRLKVVPIDGGKGPVAPSEATINDGRYAPLSRPLFLYVGAQAAERPEVKAFVDFYLKHAPQLAGEVGYVALPARAYQLATARFHNGIVGSAFAGKKTTGMTIEDILAVESPGT